MSLVALGALGGLMVAIATKLGFGSGIIIGPVYLGLSPPFIRADLRSIV